MGNLGHRAHRSWPAAGLRRIVGLPGGPSSAWRRTRSFAVRSARLVIGRSPGLAHRLQDAIDADEELDQAEVARRLGFTRARVSQLLDLTLLAPDVQEAILFLEAVDGVEPVTERGLRSVVAVADWGEQRVRWAGIVRKAAGWRSGSGTPKAPLAAYAE